MSTATTIKPADRFVSAGTYDIDPIHSRVGFAVKHLGINVVRGRFHGFEGTIEVGDDLGALNATGVVEAASVDTGFAQRDEHLRTGDFFDIENNPDIRFSTTGVRQVEEQTFQLSGDITIRGVKKPIVLDTALAGTAVDQYDNLRLGLAARGQVSRSAFGMGFSTSAAGVPLVADKVELALDIEAILRH